MALARWRMATENNLGFRIISNCNLLFGLVHAAANGGYFDKICQRPREISTLLFLIMAYGGQNSTGHSTFAGLVAFLSNNKGCSDSGLSHQSLSVTANFAVNGKAPGTDLARGFLNTGNSA